MAKRNPSYADSHQHPIRPPLRILIIFAMGQFGWSLASFAVGNLLVYFYMPPEQGLPTFPSFLFQGAVLGVLTLVGLLSAGGRVLDGLVDPFVANWSDRKQASVGKRRWFMLRGAVPFALFGALVFFPVSASENATNFIWLALVISLYYFFFALYVIPYNALMAELGHTPQERLKISTLVSVAWALGFVVGNSTYALQGVFEALGKTPVEAFQTVIVLLQVVAMVFMLLPALFINEQRYARQSQSDHGIRDAVRTVFRNHNFRWFLLSFLLYWLALTFIQLGIGFYTTLLFGLDKSLAFTFSLVSFASSFLLYWPVNILAKKLGNKTMMLVAYLLFGSIFMVTAFSQHLAISKEWLLYGLGIAAAGPLAIFGILPNAIVGDEADRAAQSSGQQLTGMYFGLTAFTMKIGISLANLIFPSLLLFGRSTENPLGVQATALAAVLFCLTGWWAFRKFGLTADGLR
jgi:GPH family glycoside/pentoside/hexuronide:cation symporter